MGEGNWRLSTAPKDLTDVMLCTAQLDDGETCGRPSAVRAPFPICERHVIAAYKYAARLIGAQHVVELPVQQRGSAGGAGNGPGKKRLTHTGTKGFSMNGWPSVVYYARIGDHIKIGHTKNLAERMKWYPPSTVILALEPGDVIVERSRQWKFDHLLDAREEWFRPGEDLMRHIELLAAAGLPARS